MRYKGEILFVVKSIGWCTPIYSHATVLLDRVAMAILSSLWVYNLNGHSHFSVGS